ncbi:hypothetical protein TWF694_010232 [Orbilia ellipsospora]|uniref:Uncharacterized protein n=1 Tax=Orbilia ellipsospora TaxID=2528407 RepID=A0AAV9XA72_9PEZI
MHEMMGSGVEAKSHRSSQKISRTPVGLYASAHVWCGGESSSEKVVSPKWCLKPVGGFRRESAKLLAICSNISSISTAPFSLNYSSSSFEPQLTCSLAYPLGKPPSFAYSDS